MPVIANVEKEDFTNVLAAAGRSTEIPESADVYGWLIGSWELEVVHYRGVDLSAAGLRGEVHFGWALEGRAVQDVWIMPRRSERTAETGKTNNMFGTTLRIWDPAIQAWQIGWINPVSGHFETQTGRRVGNDIVQVALGTTARRRAGDSPKSHRIRFTGLENR